MGRRFVPFRCHAQLPRFLSSPTSGWGVIARSTWNMNLCRTILADRLRPIASPMQERTVATSLPGPLASRSGGVGAMKRFMADLQDAMIAAGRKADLLAAV
jgi:hypothetical protein